MTDSTDDKIEQAKAEPSASVEQERAEYIQDLTEEILELIDQAMTADQGPYLTHAETCQALEKVRQEIGRIHDPSDHQQAIIDAVRGAESEITVRMRRFAAMDTVAQLTDRDCIELWENYYSAHLFAQRRIIVKDHKS